MEGQALNELIEFLVVIGDHERFEDFTELLTRFPQFRSGQLMRLNFSEWYAVADSLESPKLVSLVKALTIVEARVPNCGGGSVSPVIWLFRKLAEREIREIDDVSDWVLRNSQNTYLPFGSFNYGAKSLVEYQLLAQSHAKRTQERLAADALRQEQDAIRKRGKATTNLFGALRRQDTKAVEALLLQGAEINAEGPDGRVARAIIESEGLGKLLEVPSASSSSKDK